MIEGFYDAEAARAYPQPHEQMNVLDIDLDVFQDQIVTMPQGPNRPSSKNIAPWSAAEVEHFMRDQCNLNPNQPIPGCVVGEHDEVFDIWGRLIESKRLEVPFDLIHVDAHADMGMGFGDASVSYIMGELLHEDISQRIRPQRGNHKGLMPSNYVAFAMACRWIRSFTYVHHPNLVRENAGLHDIPNSYFKDFNPRNDRLQFNAVNPESVNGIRRPTSDDVVDIGPEIPITLVPTHEFSWKEVFSYVFVAKSPRYAAVTSDELLPTLGRFVAEIPECCRWPQ